MDFVDGQDPCHQLSDKYPVGMPVDQVIPIVAAVANALDYAHKKGLLHRDVKHVRSVNSGPGDGTRIELIDVRAETPDRVVIEPPSAYSTKYPNHGAMPEYTTPRT